MIDWAGIGKNALWVSGLAIMLAGLGWAGWLAACRGTRLHKALAARSVLACFEVGLAVFGVGLLIGANSVLQRALRAVLLLYFATDRLLARRAAGETAHAERRVAGGPPCQSCTSSAFARKVAEIVASAEPLLILVVAPFLMFPNRFTLPFALLLTLPWLARKLARGHFTARTALDAPLALLLCMLPISLWTAADLQFSAPKLFGIVLGVAVFYGVVNFARNTRCAWILAAALVWMGLGVSLLALLGTEWSEYHRTKLFSLPQIYGHLPHLLGGVPGVEGGGFHPNQVAGTMCLFVPYAYGLLLLGFSRHDKLADAGTSRWHWSGYLLWALLLALLCMASTLLLTQSRSALVGVGCGLLVVTAFRPRLFWPALALGLLAVTLTWRHMGPEQVSTTILQALTEPSVTRVEVWQRALFAIADFPYTGVGLNQFPIVVNLLYPLFSTTPEAVMQLAHAHNVFLQVAVDLGIPGLVAYLALLLGFTFAFLTAYRHVPTKPLRAVSAGLLGGMLAYHVYGLTDCLTLGAKPGVAIWAMWGLMAALANLAVEDQAAGPSREEDQGEAPAVGLG